MLLWLIMCLRSLMNWHTRCGVCNPNACEPSLKGPGSEPGADVQNQKAKIAPATHDV